ncbi:MAG: MBL fold metallo-hydrolase [Actinomycetota bacterium]|nr:MBL fold metallo-hydrolase [Actinomycetota bacterium]
MRLSIFGHAGSYGAPGAQCSSYLVSAARTHLLLDIGNGSFSNLGRQIMPGDLDAVFISHRHHDHLADLISLYHYLTFVPGALRHPIPLYASSVTLESIRTLVAADFGRILLPHEVEAGDAVEVGPLQVSFAAADHVPGTLATLVRVAGGPSLGYTADTGPSPALEAFFEGADLLLGESTWLSRPDGAPPGLHMDASDLAAMATRAKVRRLVVTHVAYPGNATAAARLVSDRFSGEVIAAFDGLAVEF